MSDDTPRFTFVVEPSGRHIGRDRFGNVVAYGSADQVLHYCQEMVLLHEGAKQRRKAEAAIARDDISHLAWI